MSPIEARPIEIQVAAVPDDHDIDARHSRPQEVHSTSSRRWANSSFRSTVCRPRHVFEQLAHFAAERPHDADAGERFAHAAIDLLHVLADRRDRSAGSAAQR